MLFSGISHLPSLSYTQIAGVYVSSDRTDDAIEKHAALLPSDFYTVPSPEARSGLKILFGACAGSERGSLNGIERKHGIPTIVVIDSETQKVLSETGVADIQTHGEECVQLWENKRSVEE